MWNLDEKKLQEMLDGFLNFQEVWTLEKVKNMLISIMNNKNAPIKMLFNENYINEIIKMGI